MKQKKAAKPANTKKNNRFFSRMFPRGHNQKKKKREIPSTQKSLPYKAMYRDGICHGKDGRYSKTVRFFDINYQLAQNEDKASIFESWCDFLNYFDSSIHFDFVKIS